MWAKDCKGRSLLGKMDAPKKGPLDVLRGGQLQKSMHLGEVNFKNRCTQDGSPHKIDVLRGNQLQKSMHSRL